MLLDKALAVLGLFASAVVAIALASLKRKVDDGIRTARDRSLWFFVFAFVAWSLMYLTRLLGLCFSSADVSDAAYTRVLSYLSSINNMLLLYGISKLDHAPSKWRKLPGWLLPFSTGLVIASCVVIDIFARETIIRNTFSISWWLVPEVVYSMCTAMLIPIVLWSSFTAYRFRGFWTTAVVGSFLLWIAVQPAFLVDWIGGVSVAQKVSLTNELRILGVLVDTRSAISLFGLFVFAFSMIYLATCWLYDIACRMSFVGALSPRMPSRIHGEETKETLSAASSMPFSSDHLKKVSSVGRKLALAVYRNNTDIRDMDWIAVATDCSDEQRYAIGVSPKDAVAELRRKYTDVDPLSVYSISAGDTKVL